MVGLPGRRPWNRAKGADPKPAPLKGETCFWPLVPASCARFSFSGVLLLPGPGFLVFVLGFRRLGLAGASSFFWVLFSRARFCLFLFLFLLLASGVTFQLLEGGASGQTQGHRPKDRLFQVPLWTFDVL